MWDCDRLDAMTSRVQNLRSPSIIGTLGTRDWTRPIIRNGTGVHTGPAPFCQPEQGGLLAAD